MDPEGLVFLNSIQCCIAMLRSWAKVSMFGEFVEEFYCKNSCQYVAITGFIIHKCYSLFWSFIALCFMTEIYSIKGSYQRKLSTSGMLMEILYIKLKMGFLFQATQLILPPLYLVSYIPLHLWLKCIQYAYHTNDQFSLKF